jgi:hypothetical protein
MTEYIDVSPETGKFRSREVDYVSGPFDQIFRRIPEFELGDFRFGDSGVVNPNYRTVVRKPLQPQEVAVPVGIVSPSYALVQHREVANLCRDALQAGKLSIADLKCDLGLTPLGEYMVFRAYLPDASGFTARDGMHTSLRLECINSVDGSHRLVMFYSWLRLVCLNGMMVRDTMTQVKEVHDYRLDLEKVREAITTGLGRAAKDVKQLQQWDNDQVDLNRFRGWVDENLAGAWGKKAASRVYFIAMEGRDIEWADPFEHALPSERTVHRLEVVPGAKLRSETLYDVLQALTYVATQRPNVEERLEWQSMVPKLMADLKHIAMTNQRWGTV